MTLNILDSKTEIHDEEDLRKMNHLRGNSMNAKNKKGEQSGYKARTKIEEWFGYKTELKWMYIAGLTFLHIGTLYSLFTLNIFGNIMTLASSEYSSRISVIFINSISRKSTGATNIILIFLEDI